MTYVGAFASRAGTVLQATTLFNSTAVGFDSKVATNNTVVLGNSLVTSIQTAGGIQINTAGGGSQPACDVSNRGKFWYVAGVAGVKDRVEVCAKDSSDVYAWRVIY
jgi:hypothetical protein